MDAVGAQLGDFRLVGILGEGASGRVYEAAWGPRTVALKVMRAELASDPARADRFKREATLLKRISHPSVVKVLQVGDLPDGRPYLAMEKLDGETLAARLVRGAIDLGTGLGLFEQVAGAVAALHDGGLVHRDVKPENVFLIRGGSYAVLLDVGIAKDPGEVTRTEVGVVRGTPAYMAPERFFGRPASHASDVYELALLLYVLVCGRTPWAQHTDPEARLRPPPPHQLGVQVPSTLESVIMSGLASRPEDRPPSVAALIERVRGAMATASWNAAEAAAAAVPMPAAAPAVVGRRSARSSGPLWAAGGAAITAAVLGAILWARPVRETLVPPTPCEGLQLAACREVGVALAYGRGVTQNHARAARFLDPACEAGDAEACALSGRLALRGQGRARDPAAAARLLERACDASAGVHGCADLALMIRDGDGVAADPARAMALHQRACEAGDGVSCTNLGYAYSQGTGVAVDYEESVRLYRRACEAGDPTGCSNLAFAYRNGQGVSEDLARAAALYVQACTEGSGLRGCVGAAEMYAGGLGVAEDDARAAGYWLRGCDGGVASACESAGYAYAHGNGVGKDEARARELYRRACDGSNGSTGCNNLGVLLSDGKGGARDDAAAVALFTRACHAGSAFGCGNLGLMYSEGRGVPANPPEALRYYRLGCDGGHPLSCEQLEKRKK